MTFQLQLLGLPALRGPDGSEVRFPTRKAAALFNYLADSGGDRLPRESLGTLLWPRSGPEQSRASLRQELAVIRKALRVHGFEAVVSDSETVAIDFTNLEVDSLRLRALCRTADPSNSEALRTLYSGAFLEGVSALNTPFDDWVWMTRAALQQDALALALASLNGLDVDAPPQTVEAAAYLVLRIDPAEEQGHYRLIEALRDQGHYGRALRQLQTCRTAIAQMLDAPPSARIDALEAELLRSRASVPQNPVQPPSVLKARNGMAASAPDTAREPVTASDLGERRLLIGVSVNLSGLVDGVDDPEDWAEALKSPRERIISEIQSQGGLVQRSDHDLVLACYGYPISGEHEPERVVRLWYSILNSSDFKAVRVGIAGGHAVVKARTTGNGPMAAGEFLATGSFLATAEQLSHSAAPGEITITNEIADAIGSEFDTEIAGAARQVVAVRHALRADSRLHRARRPAFVGRTLELETLDGLFRAAESGEGKAVLIAGEPGIGKSRLVHEFLSHRVCGDPKAFHFQGSPHETDTTFFALTDYLTREVVGADTNSDLADWLAGFGNKAHAIHPYLFALLSSEDIAPPASDLHDLGEQALSIFSWLASSQQQADQPQILIFDDAQWLDPTTLEALGSLLQDLSSHRVFVLITVRSGMVPSELDFPDLYRLSLSGLAEAEARLLVMEVGRDAGFDDEILHKIVPRGDGIPLVLEEIARTIADRGVSTPDLAGDVVPLSLSGMLSERLDQMPEVRPLVQSAAVLGRQFAVQTLARMTRTKVADLSPKLDRLLQTGLLYKRRRGAAAEFVFRHALLQEFAYSTILKSARKAMHANAAAAMLEGQGTETRAAIIARHLMEAGQTNEAILQFERAAIRADRISAHREAATQYGHALDAVADIEKSQERDKLELRLLAGHVSQRNLTRGIPTEEVIPSIDRVIQLSEKLGDHRRHVEAGLQLWSIYLVQARMHEALHVGQRVLNLAERSQDPIDLCAAATMCGNIDFYQGAYVAAREKMERAAAIYRDRDCETHRTRFGVNMGMYCNGYLSWILALMDEPELAKKASARAEAIAEDMDNGYSRAFTSIFTAARAFFLDEIEEGEMLARHALDLATKHEIRHWQAMSRIMLARAADLRGEHDALDELRAGFDAYLATGVNLAAPYCHAWIAESLINRGRYAAAATELDLADAFAQTSGEEYFLSEALRLRAHLALANAETLGTVSKQFTSALQLAESQGATRLAHRILSDMSALLVT